MASKDTYLVVFKDGISEADQKKHAAEIEKAGGKVHKHFGDVLTGFSAQIPESYLKNLQGNDSIAYIEPDQEVRIQ